MAKQKWIQGESYCNGCGLSFKNGYLNSAGYCRKCEDKLSNDIRAYKRIKKVLDS